MSEVSHGDFELLDAARKNSLPDVQNAIERLRADANAQEPPTGMTPLHYAVEKSNVPLVKFLLLGQKAKFDLEDKKKRTAVSRALEIGDAKVLQLFEERGAIGPPEPVAPDALVNATQEKDAEKVRELLAKMRSGRARVNIDHRKEKEMRTALHVAAAAGQRVICELLLAAGASLEIKDRDGQTPLFSAVQYRRVPLIELLLSRGASVEARNKHGYTALHRACRDGNTDTISAFFAKSAMVPVHVNIRELTSATGQTPLFSAARSYRPAAVRLLLKDLKVNAAAQDQSGDTALHYLCADSVSEERRNPRRDTLRAMIEGGSPLNATNNDGQTPIFKAIAAPARELVECLLAAGAILKVQDKDGNTPLHVAVSSQAAEAEGIVALLLQAPLDPYVQNNAGISPLELAITESTKTMLRGYVPPMASAPAAAQATSPAPAKQNPPAAQKRKGSTNEILVASEDDEEGEVRTSAGAHQQLDKRPRREPSLRRQGSSGSSLSSVPASSSSGGTPYASPPPLVRVTPPAAAGVQQQQQQQQQQHSPSPAPSNSFVEPTEPVRRDEYIAFEPHDTRPLSISDPSHPAPAAAGLSPLPPPPKQTLHNSSPAQSPSPYINLRESEPLDPQRAASLGPIIEHGELTLGTVIGEGAFGAVRKGEWNLMPVAVKILHKSDPKATQMFYKEVELFNKIRHKHIARYLGSCIKPPLCMVMEFYPESLMNRIAAHPLDVPSLLHIAHGVALAMLHLHSRKIIHRDIKPSNILLDEHLNPYVADFGVSREYGQPGTMTGIGTPLYMAPEMLTTKKYSEKVDQYAFAMLLWQMLTGKSIAKGFHEGDGDEEDVSPIQIAFRAATQGWRPPLPQGAPPELRKLIEACWDHSPEARPGFDKIANSLHALIMASPRK